MNRLLYFVLGTIVVFVGYEFIADQRDKAFAEVMGAEQAGYRLEYFEKEKLLFLHAPDGSKDGMPLDGKCIYMIAALRIPAADNALNKDIYRWEISYVLDINGSWMRRSLLVPLFAVEPAELMRVVKRAVPDLDVAKGVDYAEQVKRGDMDTAVVWEHPEHDGATSPPPGMICKPS